MREAELERREVEEGQVLYLQHRGVILNHPTMPSSIYSNTTGGFSEVTCRTMHSSDYGTSNDEQKERRREMKRHIEIARMEDVRKRRFAWLEKRGEHLIEKKLFPNVVSVRHREADNISDLTDIGDDEDDSSDDRPCQKKQKAKGKK